MFELSCAIENWQNELRTNQSIEEDDIIELTAHLVDEIEDLQSQSLSAEESFWVATHRLGDAKAIQAEFSKINQAIVWRRRLMTLLLGYFLFSALRSLIDLMILPVYLVDVQWLLVDASRIYGPNFSVPLPLFFTILAIFGVGFYLMTTKRIRLFSQSKLILSLKVERNLVFAILAASLVLMIGSFVSTILLAWATDVNTLGSFAVSRNVFSVLWNLFLFISLAVLSFVTLCRPKPNHSQWCP